jgi:hypothetical protein
LNQLWDSYLYITFLLPPSECLPSNLFHHHNPDMSKQPISTNHPAHTIDLSRQTKAQFDFL